MAEDTEKIEYRNHTIRAIPVEDPDGGGWIAQFKALKHEGDVTRGKDVKDPKLHVHEDKGEAIKHSLSLGMLWVDGKEGSP